jgi:hypothetical protein
LAETDGLTTTTFGETATNVTAKGMQSNPLFGNLTEWDCTNEDHRPVICFRIGRMHWQPAERQRRVPRKPIVSA